MSAARGSKHRVRFGFLGAGWIAQKAFAPAVHAADGVVLQAVAARDGARAGRLEPAGRVHAGPGGYTALLADDEVDAVYISLTNDQHAPWTIAALQAGKHVICEKPLGLDPGEVVAMHDAAAGAGRVLLEGFFYRWHPRMRRIEGLVDSGALGAVATVRSTFCFDGGAGLAGNYRLEAERGGGALYDVGVYPISAAHALLGPDLAVTSARARIGPSGVDLDARAELGSPAGAVVELSCAISGSVGQDLVVDGDCAVLATGDGEAFTNWHAPSTLELRTESGDEHTERFGPVDPYRLMVEDFARHLHGEADLPVGREDSLAVASTLAAVRTRALS